jgi:DNA-binding CsgD family transcriptional regulator/PAS domain-containing protein
VPSAPIAWEDGGGNGVPKSDDLLATIEAIHTAGLDAELWTPALAAITRCVGGVAATLEVYGKQPFRHLECHAFGFPAASEIEYCDHYLPLNVRVPFVSRENPGGINWDYQILDEQAMNRSPFYMEFLPRIDFRYFIDGIIANSEREFAAVVVHRSARQGHIDRPGIATMQRLLPHVCQAFDVARRLKGAGEARDSLERALDWLADGVALVRTDGVVVYANATLQAMARRNDGIRLHKGSIEFAAAEARERFATAVGAIARLRNGEPQTSTDFVATRSSGEAPYVVSVRPLFESEKAGAQRKAAAVVFIHAARGHTAAATGTLRKIFGFTEAEASLAQALQAGLPLGEYANSRRLSLNTVYTHLRRIKEKTGCRRMTELIRKLNDLQVPLRLD